MKQVRVFARFVRHEQGFPRKVAGLPFKLIEVISVKEQTVMKASGCEPLAKLFEGGGR
jgi:hypothetical protein